MRDELSILLDPGVDREFASEGQSFRPERLGVSAGPSQLQARVGVSVLRERLRVRKYSRASLAGAPITHTHANKQPTN